MSSTALELARTTEVDIAQTANDPIARVQRLGNILAASKYFSDIQGMAQAAVKVMAGEELGIPPVAAVMGIHIIKGKVTLSGNLIAAQIRRHGYNFRHKQFDNKGCVLEFLGRHGELLGESSFNEEDAKAAGVYSDMYRKFPRNMYFNRAISNGAKWYCPEVTCGLPVYVPEELGAKVNSEGEFEALPEDEIDTGGAPKNTNEAAKNVAERKLRELRSQQKSHLAELGVTESDIVPHSEDQPSEIERQLEASVKTAKTSKFKEMLDAFAGVKAELAASGLEHEYYGVLGSYGVEHANEFPSFDDARKCYKALCARVSELKATEKL